MNTTKYNKLVRDKIPDIITSKGNKPVVEVLEESEYIDKLEEKLEEELNEYIVDKSIEELADLVEVIYAILKVKNVNIEEFEKIRLDKAEKRGSFDERLLLVEVNED